MILSTDTFLIDTFKCVSIVSELQKVRSSLSVLFLQRFMNIGYWPGSDPQILMIGVAYLIGQRKKITTSNNILVNSSEKKKPQKMWQFAFFLLSNTIDKWKNRRAISAKMSCFRFPSRRKAWFMPLFQSQGRSYSLHAWLIYH